MSRTNLIDTHIMEASGTTAHRADTEPATAAPPKTGKRRRLKRMITGIALAAASGAVGMVTLTTGVTAASASGLAAQGVAIAPFQSLDYFMLDVAGASQQPGAPVIQWWVNGGANQKWDFYQMDDGNYEIINDNSGQCLTNDGIAGDQLRQWPCQNSIYQEWSTQLLSGGYFTYDIVSAASGLAVDVYGASHGAGAPIDTWYPNYGYNQQFLRA